MTATPEDDAGAVEQLDGTDVDAHPEIAVAYWEYCRRQLYAVALSVAAAVLAGLVTPDIINALVGLVKSAPAAPVPSN